MSISTKVELEIERALDGEPTHAVYEMVSPSGSTNKESRLTTCEGETVDSLYETMPKSVS